MTRKFFRAGMAAACISAVAAALWIVSLYVGLPDISRLKRYRPPAATEVFDRHGSLLAQYHDRIVRFWIPVDRVPEHVVWSVVIAEDDTFFAHRGVNYKATWDALMQDVRERRFARGGSTITQQMIKNVLLSREKTVGRKVREYFLARRAEAVLTKRQIMEIYLNEVEWGEGLHGIEAASRHYFDKHTNELSLGEAALLAGMLPNPRYFDPFKRMEKARDRQERVLSNMLQAKVITADDFDAAVSAPVQLRQGASDRFGPVLRSAPGRPCYHRVLEDILLAEFGEEMLYRQGMKISTSLDKSLQDMLRAKEEDPPAGAAGAPDTLLLLKEAGEVRAISCEESEASARSSLQLSIASPPQEISFETVPAASLDAASLGAARHEDAR